MKITDITRVQQDGTVKVLARRRRQSDKIRINRYIAREMDKARKRWPHVKVVWNEMTLKPGILRANAYPARKINQRDVFKCKKCGHRSHRGAQDNCLWCNNTGSRRRREIAETLQEAQYRKLIRKVDAYNQQHNQNIALQDLMSETDQLKLESAKLNLQLAEGIPNNGSEIVMARQIYHNVNSLVRMHIPGLYTTYAHQLAVTDKPITDSTKLIWVQCKNCKKHFRPMISELKNRASALKGQLYYMAKGKKQISHGESNFYCCDSCKQECLVFNLKSDSSFLDNSCKQSARGIQVKQKAELMQQQLDICGINFCENEDCNHEGTDLIFHHICPVKDGGESVTDPRLQTLLCFDCHMEWHHKPGARERMTLTAY